MAALAPFLHKAFHIDDPLFLWMAQQIAKHPLDPYGFSVNWASFPEPMWAEMQNPPLCSYFIAVTASLVGWSERALHCAFLFLATMSILGTSAIARRFCREPLVAALLTLFTPVFLVSATNVMCDVMLLALWVWSIECWLAGLERNRWWLLVLSALLIAAATLTKYFGIALVPLLGVYTLARNWRSSSRLIVLVIPLAAAAAYDFWTRSKYGHGLLSAAIFYARDTPMRSSASAFTQLLSGLCFLGGCLFAPLFYAPLKRIRPLLCVAVPAAFVAICFYFFVPTSPEWLLGTKTAAIQLEGAFFAAIGAGIVALVIFDLARDRSAENLLLALWLLGTFGFATFLNWSITARTLLPLAPAVAILLMRSVPPSDRGLLLRYWPIIPAMIMSLLVATADYRHANSARQASNVYQQRFRNENATVWFQSHWGFQYYMQQWGATPLNSLDSELRSGDVMIIPSNNTAIVQIDESKIFPPQEEFFPVLPFVSVFGRGTGAGFYTSVRGLVPWSIVETAPELYYVARFR
ncbi:MAG: glycosyltransferase family 39 protein [Spartobacteria bacterium]